MIYKHSSNLGYSSLTWVCSHLLSGRSGSRQPLPDATSISSTLVLGSGSSKDPWPPDTRNPSKLNITDIGSEMNHLKSRVLEELLLVELMSSLLHHIPGRQWIYLRYVTLKLILKTIFRPVDMLTTAMNAIHSKHFNNINPLGVDAVQQRVLHIVENIFIFIDWWQNMCFLIYLIHCNIIQWGLIIVMYNVWRESVPSFPQPRSDSQTGYMYVVQLHWCGLLLEKQHGWLYLLLAEEQHSIEISN